VSWAAALRSALGALRANALRSFLTMLGIIIGVAAVIAMVAVGRGATERVQAQMKGLGSNIMLVLPGGVSQAGVRLGAQTRQRLTEEDAQAIALEIPQVQVAAPTSRTTGQLVWGNANWGSNLIGVNNDYLEARDWPLQMLRTRRSSPRRRRLLSLTRDRALCTRASSSSIRREAI
jgi:putative ABC transport system permease protein